MIPDLNKVLAKLSNPFIKLEENEKESLRFIEQSVKKDIKEFSREAKEIYQDQRYIKLKNEFKKIYDNNIKLLLYFDSEDMNKYAMKMREYQIQLRTLKSIFDTPEGFIKQDEALDKVKK